MDTPSPYHSGERRLQTRHGVAEKAEAMGRRMIRDYMPDQHRDFFALLPFVVAAGLDDHHRPWASLLYGAPGFVHSPDPRRLDLTPTPNTWDVFYAHLHPGAPLGLLGIQPETRRRNRVNGRVSAIGAHGFRLDVHQSFGNCPKYIHTRAVAERQGAPGAVTRGTGPLHARAARLVTQSDTFFIASAHLTQGDAHTRPAAFGLDVSHRGGPAGFVRQDGTGFVFADFPGNNAYNTLGNILENPRTGYLFVDFDTGSVLQLTGKSEVWFEPRDGTAYAEGIKQRVRFEVEDWQLAEGVLPFSFTPL